jgi:hypothetical protein
VVLPGTICGGSRKPAEQPQAADRVAYFHGGEVATARSSATRPSTSRRWRWSQTYRFRCEAVPALRMSVIRRWWQSSRARRGDRYPPQRVRLAAPLNTADPTDRRSPGSYRTPTSPTCRLRLPPVIGGECCRRFTEAAQVDVEATFGTAHGGPPGDRSHRRVSAGEIFVVRRKDGTICTARGDRHVRNRTFVGSCRGGPRLFGTHLGPRVEWDAGGDLKPGEILVRRTGGRRKDPPPEILALRKGIRQPDCRPQDLFVWPPDFSSKSSRSLRDRRPRRSSTVDKQPPMSWAFRFRRSTSDPQAAIKILWNYFYRTWYFGSLRRVAGQQVAPNGLERRTDQNVG